MRFLLITAILLVLGACGLTQALDELQGDLRGTTAPNMEEDE